MDGASDVSRRDAAREGRCSQVVSVPRMRWPRLRVRRQHGMLQLARWAEFIPIAQEIVQQVEFTICELWIVVCGATATMLLERFSLRDRRLNVP